MTSNAPTPSAWTRLYDLLWVSVETKVKAASFAAFASSAVVSVVTALVGHGLPAAAVAAIDVVVPTVCTALAGWFAAHTPRGTELLTRGEHR